MKLFHAKMKVNTCIVCEICLSTEEEEKEDGEIVVLTILRMSLYLCILPTLRVATLCI